MEPSHKTPDPSDPADIQPVWREPPPPPDIPAVLREPSQTTSTPKANDNVKSEILGMGRAWSLALDFVFTVLAGAALGWLGGKYLGPMPAWVMVGLGLGFVVGFTRIVRSSLREEREAQERKNARK